MVMKALECHFEFLSKESVISTAWALGNVTLTVPTL
jgi:hypothetical protein